MPETTGQRGHPKSYKTVEDLQTAVDAYFASCKGPYIDSRGNPIIDADGNVMVNPYATPYTMSGLALALGISRMTLLRYEQQEDVYPSYCDVIRDARARVETYAETRLYDRDGARGAQFALINNHSGWADRQEVTTTSNTLIIAAPAGGQAALSGLIEQYRLAQQAQSKAAQLVEAESVEIVAEPAEAVAPDVPKGSRTKRDVPKRSKRGLGTTD